MASDKYTWGDTVEVRSLEDPDAWQVASVCAIPDPGGGTHRFLVEYDDGSSEEVSPHRLRSVPSS